MVLNKCLSLGQCTYFNIRHIDMNIDIYRRINTGITTSQMKQIIEILGGPVLIQHIEKSGCNIKFPVLS